MRNERRRCRPRGRCGGLSLAATALLAACAAAGPPIRLDDASFDPLEGVPPVPLELHVGEGALESDVRLPYLLQFRGIPADPVRLDLEALGIRVLAYVPEDAYLVAGRPSAVAAAARRAPVRWAGPLHPAWKLSPRLLRVLLDPPAAIEVHVLAAASDRIVSPGFHEIARAPVGALWKIRGRLDPRRAADLAHHAAVVRIEPVPRYRLQGERASLVAGGAIDAPSACPDAPGHRDWLARKGIAGRGVTVQLLDDGLEQGDASNRPGTAHPDLLGRIAGIENATFDADGACVGGHGSLNAGIIAGAGATGVTDASGFLLGLGVAPEARIFGTKVFTSDGEMQLGDSTFTHLIAHAARAGATLSSNSWGTDVFGEYDADAMEFDALARDADPDRPGPQSIAFFFPTGNAGSSQPGHPEHTAASPATAKNVIAVGATEGCDAAGIDGCGVPPFRADSARDLAPFSGRGPTRDGRLVPSVVAPGTHVTGPASTAWNYTGQSICDGHWPSGQTLYGRGSGTSQACPVVVGAAALLAESYRERLGRAPGPALLRALLVLGARDCAGGDDGLGGRLGNAPDIHQGWGAVRLEEVIPDAGAEPGVFCHDEARILREVDEVFEVRITVLDPAQPVRVALAWTDPPAFPGARPALVNDLDLEVEAGGLFLGNALASGVSIAGGEPDRLENLECVHIPSPPAHLIVRVRAHVLAGDGVPGDADPTDQDFALAVLNGTDRSSRGTVAFDRAAYPCAAEARILASDMDLRGAGTLRVAVRNGTVPAADLELRETPPGSGLFEGEIALRPATEPGALLVAHGDRIAVRYEDADDGDGHAAAVEDEASIDCEPPAIEEIRFGEIGEDFAEILWRTVEPATTEVLGCPGGEALVVASTLATEHRAIVRDLASGAEVRVAVASADAAGNRRIDDGGGACFRARTHAFEPTFEDDFDPQPGAGWTHGATIGADGWLLLSWQYAASPPKVWLSPAGPGARDTFLVTPPLAILPGQILEFRHSHELAVGLDGAVVEISADGGATWEDLGPAIIEGGYCGAIDRSAETSLAGRLAWTGGRRGPMARVRAEVGFWAGPDRRIRFRIAVHPRSAAWGWAIDDVRIGSLVGPRGEIDLARRRVRCDGSALVAVADADRAGAGEVVIEASGSGPPFEIRLAETSGGSGIFSGVIPLGPEGIALAEGDDLRVVYRDPDDGTGAVRVAEAVAGADCAPPKIEGIAIDESADGAVRVRWRTDEPATATVRYGTTCIATDRSASAPDRSLEHEVVLRELSPGDTVRIRASSEDEAGNVASDDAGGACHVWRALVRAPVLFDDADGGVPAGWTTGAAIGRDAWRIDDAGFQASAPASWFAADAPETTDAWLALPPITIGPHDRLVFLHTFEMEHGYDGGVIEISTDGGLSWEDLGPRILEGGYSGTLRAGPLAGRAAWTGGIPGEMRRVIADLGSYAGDGRRIRFRISCDAEGAGAGWWIDDIAVESPIGGRGEVRLDRPAY
ncbi:MAG: S8 family serine peptidase, partial [Planctomycetes bacterium]|nr:S8 family serine peptidase [Planctomycetota bacterium]